MDSTQQQIENRINQFPEVLTSLRDKAQIYSQHNSAISSEGEISIGHRPWVAPQNYAITLFPPADPAWVTGYRQKAIPLFYKDFLSICNGLFTFSLSLYGFTSSLQSATPLLDRTKLQCHDLATANHLWIAEYKIDQRLFHFGGRSYSYEENCGYFCSPDGTILSVLEDGRVVGTWNDFSSFLADELDEAERIA